MNKAGRGLAANDEKAGTLPRCSRRLKMAADTRTPLPSRCLRRSNPLSRKTCSWRTQAWNSSPNFLGPLRWGLGTVNLRSVSSRPPGGSGWSFCPPFEGMEGTVSGSSPLTCLSAWSAVVAHGANDVGEMEKCVCQTGGPLA